MVRIVLCLFIFGLCVSAFAYEKTSVEDKAIGLTFKTLAKTFISITDIDKLKKSNISKIEKMDEGKFKKRYHKIYEALKELPLSIRTAYGIEEDADKKEIIRMIEQLDKKEIYKMIAAIPDETIVSLFKRYLKERRQEIQKASLVKQINKIWLKMINKAQNP